MILTPLQKMPKNVEDLGKLIVAKGFKKLPKVQKIAQSGHTGLSMNERRFKKCDSSHCTISKQNTFLPRVVIEKALSNRRHALFSSVSLIKTISLFRLPDNPANRCIKQKDVYGIKSWSTLGIKTKERNFM